MSAHNDENGKILIMIALPRNYENSSQSVILLGNRCLLNDTYIQKSVLDSAILASGSTYYFNVI